MSRSNYLSVGELTMRQNSELVDILHAGSFLIDPTRSTLPSDLQGLLVSRLAQYHAALGRDKPITPSSNIAELQLETAQEALSVVERVQKILCMGDPPVSSTLEDRVQGKATIAPLDEAPAIGTRDLAQLRTLLSIVFKWGVEPLLILVMSAWPSKPSPVLLGPKIIDLTTTPEDYRRLSSLLLHLLTLLFPSGVHGFLPQTLITTTLLNRHLTDLLKPCMALGWLPKSLSSEATPTVDEIRPNIMRLLEILPPSQTISALGAVLSETPTPAIHTRKSCASLLSRQLLRPEGVLGLCVAVFGDGEDFEENVPIEKLEHVAKVLSTVPTSVKPKEYFNLIIPRVLTQLSDSSPLTHKRAAAFALSRMLATDNFGGHQNLAVSVIIPIFHGPFLQATDVASREISSDLSSSTALYTLSPTSALSKLMMLVMHTDPSPTLISVLLSPIMPSLYALSAQINYMKTADPMLKESVRGLLATWGRVVELSECLENLWRVLEGAGGDWEVHIAGKIKKVERSDRSGLSLLTPEDLRRAEETGELDFNSNLLNLRPDPVHFIHFLKSIDRTDVASDLFVKLLETYRDMRTRGDDDPMRTLLYLQVIIQMQTQLAEGAGPSNILTKPEHILSFIKHALTSATTAQPPAKNQGPQRKTAGSLTVVNLRMMPQNDDLSDGGDSDDEAVHPFGISIDGEMTETAVDLLLAVLEANDELSARTAPILSDIFLLLEPLANERSINQPLAREARMVMTARLASTSGKEPSKSTPKYADKERTQAIYQNALKLLQDPILPVRAHGLFLLRQLVSPWSSSLDKSHVDLALIPSIISIFLQAIQDDDSYMFLNAVQGLAAMVETVGKDVLKSLVAEYSEHLDGLAGSNMTQNDVDKRLRVGEALGQVIRRCGDALGVYAEEVVPPLVHVFRSRHIPTILRTSALSLLSECIKASSLATLPYAVDLPEAMIDLLQIESVPDTPGLHKQKSEPIVEGEVAHLQETVDSQPTSTDAKHPPLRRASLHFLTQLLHASTAGAYDSRYQSPFSGLQVKRMKITLAYVASTDKDGVVRLMAREAMDAVDQLTEAMMRL